MPGTKIKNVFLRFFFLGFQGTRSLIMTVLAPFGVNVRRMILGAFLYKILKPVSNLMPSFSKFTLVVSVDNVLVKFRPFIVHDSLYVLASKDHEPNVQQVFQPKSGDVVVDLGAHIGFYTLRSAKAVGENGVVVAVEPDPQNFKILKENIALNKIQNVIALNAAVSNLNCQRLFYCSTDPSLSGFQSNTSETIMREKIKVKTLTLNELLRNLKIDRVDWLKIDVEGEELNVLHGGTEALAASGDVKLIIEISSQGKAILGKLGQMGFSTRYLGDINYFAYKKP